MIGLVRPHRVGDQLAAAGIGGEHKKARRPHVCGAFSLRPPEQPPRRGELPRNATTLSLSTPGRAMPTTPAFTQTTIPGRLRKAPSEWTAHSWWRRVAVGDLELCIAGWKRRSVLGCLLAAEDLPLAAFAISTGSGSPAHHARRRRGPAAARLCRPRGILGPPPRRRSRPARRAVLRLLPPSRHDRQRRARPRGRRARPPHTPELLR